jgi:hypothetical protein
MFAKMYFRGVNPSLDVPRIRTGSNDWDNNLFVSADRSKALLYGKTILTYKLKPETKVLVENSPQFKKIIKKPKHHQNLLEWCTDARNIAKNNGYDVLEFNNQSDIGTVIINRDSVIQI